LNYKYNLKKINFWIIFKKIELIELKSLK